MATHDPLTQSQLDMLASLPFEVDTAGLQSKQPDLLFLQNLGLVEMERTHISTDTMQNRFRFTRSFRPLPGEAS